MPRVNDPDFGPIDLPDHEPISDEEWDAMKERMRDGSFPRAWPAGSTSACPRCDKETFEGSDDLSVETFIDGRAVVFMGLRGARCDECNAQSLEAEDQMRLEEKLGNLWHVDFEAKVSSIGSGSLGTYWPKDVVRQLGLRPKDRAFIQIISPEAALVRFRRAPPDAADKA